MRLPVALVVGIVCISSIASPTAALAYGPSKPGRNVTPSKGRVKSAARRLTNARATAIAVRGFDASARSGPGFTVAALIANDAARLHEARAIASRLPDFNASGSSHPGFTIAAAMAKDEATLRNANEMAMTVEGYDTSGASAAGFTIAALLAGSQAELHDANRRARGLRDYDSSGSSRAGFTIAAVLAKTAVALREANELAKTLPHYNQSGAAMADLTIAALLAGNEPTLRAAYRIAEQSPDFFQSSRTPGTVVIAAVLAIRGAGHRLPTPSPAYPRYSPRGLTWEGAFADIKRSATEYFHLPANPTKADLLVAGHLFRFHEWGFAAVGGVFHGYEDGNGEVLEKVHADPIVTGIMEGYVKGPRLPSSGRVRSTARSYLAHELDRVSYSAWWARYAHGRIITAMTKGADRARVRRGAEALWDFLARGEGELGWGFVVTRHPNGRVKQLAKGTAKILWDEYGNPLRVEVAGWGPFGKNRAVEWHATGERLAEWTSGAFSAGVDYYNSTDKKMTTAGLLFHGYGADEPWGQNSGSAELLRTLSNDGR